jgi:hypothetical protein
VYNVAHLWRLMFARHLQLEGIKIRIVVYKHG